MSSQHGHAASHGSLKSYLAGFALSIVLTFLSFGCVMSGAVPHDLIMPGIVVFCVAQVLVQLVFFLHLSAAPGQRDNLLIGLFSLLIIAIIIVGSLWVMHNMNANMIPATTGGSMSVG